MILTTPSGVRKKSTLSRQPVLPAPCAKADVPILEMAARQFSRKKSSLNLARNLAALPGVHTLIFGTLATWEFQAISNSLSVTTPGKGGAAGASAAADIAVSCCVVVTLRSVTLRMHVMGCVTLRVTASSFCLCNLCFSFHSFTREHSAKDRPFIRSQSWMIR